MVRFMVALHVEIMDVSPRCGRSIAPRLAARRATTGARCCGIPPFVAAPCGARLAQIDDVADRPAYGGLAEAAVLRVQPHWQPPTRGGKGGARAIDARAGRHGQ